MKTEVSQYYEERTELLLPRLNRREQLIAANHASDTDLMLHRISISLGEYVA